MSDRNDKAVKAVALTAATLALLGGVAGCSESKATPMDDQYSGNSGETQQSQEEQSQSSGDADAGTDDSASSDAASGKDTGNYKDGTYSVNGQYGPVGEDSIDVHFTIKDQNVETVEVIGHPFTQISKQHQTDFANAINGVVDGKPLKGLKVDKVAGASWTSDAFNKALDVVRQQASVQ
ncbi:FMN-binding protein [Bifidobacterium sp. UTCIF-37]|uniref:FMN-binding protein n=1 Tax=unclassified Bifidobacterium TaxID=2608897 RepID=UPI0011266C2B|nr:MULTISPECIES: FMN-binding protein [unclassified Bifidobacterium]TPF86076.1 FMN-binding protein [Bifidobacterium sp. UTCIF-37]TPF88199.1 FMN-binding protein [Bifidobacterium sp. UTCIF-38]